MEQPSERAWQPYGDGDPPLSLGRFLLSEMIAEYCEVQWEITPAETLYAIRDPEAGDADGSIRSTLGFLWSLLISGDIRTFVRPFGGGNPEPFPASCWEIDDAIARFESSAVDPVAWTNSSAPPTHWIFVDRSDFDAFMTGWCYPEPDARDDRSEPLTALGTAVDPIGRSSEASPRRTAVTPRSVIRLPEVKSRSGLSRSQIYKRMDEDTFPLSIELGARMVGWYEDEVDEWVAALRPQPSS